MADIDDGPGGTDDIDVGPRGKMSGSSVGSGDVVPDSPPPDPPLGETPLEPSSAQPPEASAPQYFYRSHVPRRLFTTRGGSVVHLIETVRPWWLTVGALVVPTSSAGDFGNLGAEMQADYDLPDQTAPVYADAPDSILVPRKAGTYDTLTGLGSADVRSGLRVVFATSQDRSLGQSAELVGQAVSAAMSVADRFDVRTIALPLIGAGAAGLDVDDVARETVSALRALKHGPPHIVLVGATVNIAERIQFAALGQRSPAPSNDSATGDDQLDVEIEASAIAEMITLREAEPPLAVGVIGDWGGGKSFFMHLIEKKILDARRDLVVRSEAWASDPADRPETAGHPYIVRFNAWTFAKTSLWAALMKEIIDQLDQQLMIERTLRDIAEATDAGSDDAVARELSRFPDFVGGDAAVQTSRLELEAFAAAHGIDLGASATSLAGIRHLANEQATEAATRAARIDRQITAVEAQLRRHARAHLESELKDIYLTQFRNELRHAIFKIPAVDEVADGVAELRQASEDVEVDVVAIRKQHWLSYGWAAGVILVGIAGIAVSLAVDWFASIPTLATLLVLLPKALGGVRRVARQVAAATAELRSIVDAAAEEVASREQAFVDQLRGESKRQMDDDRAEVDMDVEPHPDESPAQLADRLAALEAARVAAEGALAAAKQLRDLSKDFKALEDIISQKAQTGDYDGELGIMQRVKTDLEEIRRPLRAPGEIGSNDPFALSFPRGVPRIVVFVDDLDRCPPDRVVEVFEAAQLLLRSELFVLVIAIDDRYVTRALEQRYAGVLRADHAPTGHDYLEKIIQIPYRMRTVDPDALGGYIDSLFGPQESADLAGDGVSEVVAVTQDHETPPLKGLPDDDSSPERSAREVLAFSAAERAQVRDVLREVQLSPRTIKRIINVSKLIKLVQHRRGPGLSEPDLRIVVQVLVLAAENRYEAHDAIRTQGDNLEEWWGASGIDLPGDFDPQLLRTVLSFAFTCDRPAPAAEVENDAVGAAASATPGRHR